MTNHQIENRTLPTLPAAPEQSPELVDLAARLNVEHRACEAALQAGLRHAINAGNLLVEAKSLCQHGEWLPWLREHFEGSERTAQSYMRVARHYALDDLKNATVADLSYREAVRMLAEPRETPQPLDTLPPIEERSPWRRYVEDVIGRLVCETPEAYREASGIDLDGEELYEEWFSNHLARIAAVYWFRHPGCANCQRPETSNYACMPLPPGLPPTAQNLIRLGTLTNFRIGDFANWADRHGMMETVMENGRDLIRFLNPKPERFQDCDCAWCEETRSEAPERSHQLHIAATGWAWLEAGMILVSADD